MVRPSLSTTRRLFVLLVQPSRDDSLEMYAEFLRYPGLVVIPVWDPRDALMLAPRRRYQVSPIVVGARVPGRQTGSAGAWCDVFLPKPCLRNDLLGEVQRLLICESR